MGRDKKYIVIGAFGFGALVLSLVTIIVLGSLRLFSEDQHFVLYFDESINGLSVGAPIKFRGVPIGQVADIRIRYNQREDSAAIPVFGRVDARRLTETLGIELDFSDASQVDQLVKSGLRGRLQLESLITGQLFVELDFVEEDPATINYHQKEWDLNEIPTAPSVMAQVGTTTSDIFAKLSAVDLEQLSDKWILLLDKTSALLVDLRAAELSTSFIAASEAITRLAGDEHLLVLIEEARATLTSFRELAETADAGLGPTLQEAQGIMKQLEQTLQSFDTAAVGMSELLAPNAPARENLERALRELMFSARALRDLSEFLERNPGSIFFGRESN